MSESPFNLPTGISVEDDLYDIRQKLMHIEVMVPNLIKFMEDVNRKAENTNNKLMQLEAEIKEIKQQLMNRK